MISDLSVPQQNGDFAQNTRLWKSPARNSRCFVWEWLEWKRDLRWCFLEAMVWWIPDHILSEGCSPSWAVSPTIESTFSSAQVTRALCSCESQAPRETQFSYSWHRLQKQEVPELYIPQAGKAVQVDVISYRIQTNVRNSVFLITPNPSLSKNIYFHESSVVWIWMGILLCPCNTWTPRTLLIFINSECPDRSFNFISSISMVWGFF